MFYAIISIVICYSAIQFVIAADPPGGYYTTRYDHLDIENILNQKRLVVYYAACLLEKGPCTPQGTEFKSILPEAIKTNCLRCTEKQRIVTTRSIKRLKKEYPDIWAQLEKRWDPTGENVKRLLASVNRPRPVSEVPSVFDRFGDDVPKQDENRSAELVDDSTTSTSTTSTARPTERTSIITESSTSSTTTDTIFTATPRTVIFRASIKPVTARPFNSIGPNLMVLNPKAIIDKVFQTADIVLNTVTGVLKGK